MRKSPKAWLLILLASLYANLANLQFLPGSLAANPGVDWDPRHTKIFVIGVLKWKSKDLDSFSVHNRRDDEIVQQFLNLGTPRDNVVYLANEKATLKTIKSELSARVKSCEPDETFVFYYCGHGWLDDNGRGYFANYDAGDTNESCLAVDDIVKIFKANFHGKNALFFVDCCRSGSLADALQSLKCGFKFGALAAAVAGEDSTGNWTFSQAVLDTLEGHAYADSNRDGVITFDELGKYIKDEMRLLEGQDASVASGNGFDTQTKLASVSFKQEPVPERVEVKYEGEWWKAKLLERNGQKGHIHWIQIGWDAPDDDVWVPLSDVRPLSEQTVRKSQKNVSQSNSASTLTLNQKISVLWEGKYYAAVVRKIDGNRFYIHYDNYNDSYDEWVGFDRINLNRPVSSGATADSTTSAFTIKQSVSVLWQGKYYPAVILKVDGKKYFVHYSGYDTSSDEWVSQDRIKSNKGSNP